MKNIIPTYYIQQTNHHFDGAISLLEVKADMAVNAQQQQRDDVNRFNMMIPHLISVIGNLRTIRQAHINACTFGGRLGEKTRSEVGRLIENLEGHLGHDKKTILKNLLAAKVAWEEMHDMDSVSQT